MTDFTPPADLATGDVLPESWVDDTRTALIWLNDLLQDAIQPLRLIRDHTTIDNRTVVSSSEVTVATVSVPAGWLGADDAVKVRWTLHYYHGAEASNDDIHVRIKWGGNTVIDAEWNNTGFDTATDRRVIFAELVVGNQGAVSSQLCAARCQLSGYCEPGAYGATAEEGQSHRATSIDTSAAATDITLTVEQNQTSTTVELVGVEAMIYPQADMTA